jgi:hypothetical protein
MPLEHERAFSAESPVGRYWLRNCVGFQVKGLRGGAGVVEEIGLGPDGVDVLAVRRHNILLPATVLVPTQRVESVRPWEDTIVLASQRRHTTNPRAAQAEAVALRLKPIGRTAAQRLKPLAGTATHRLKPFAGIAARRLLPIIRTAAVEVGCAVRDGASVILRLLAAFGTLLWGLAVLTRDRAPHAGRRVAATLKHVVRAYAREARRVWRVEREAIAAWRQTRRERAEQPGDDGPLTRAGDDEKVAARRRDALRRR